MSEYHRHQHSVYLLTYHAVLVVKYRRKVINPDIMELIKQTVSHLIETTGGSLLELNGEEDHVHVLFELPPTATPVKIINSIKTMTSRYVRRDYENQIANKLWKDSFWSDSYFLTTTGGVNIDTVKKYIENQGNPNKRKGRPRKTIDDLTS